MKYFKTGFGIAIVSSCITLLLFIGVFELFENWRYGKWKEQFQGQGWLGKVTIPSPNPTLMWEYKPYGQYEEIRINRYGFRDIDTELKNKPENVYRIAFAGDSVTLGLYVDLEQTFSKQFELKANRKQDSVNIQALNFAIDGYNTPQILELVKTKILDFMPDKVVYVLCLNDFDFSESSGLKILYFKKPDSFFWLRMEQAYRVLSGIDFHQFHFNKNHARVFSSLVDMKQLLQNKGIAFEVVIIPVFPEKDNDYSSYPVRGIHQQLSGFLASNNIAYVDLLPLFEQQGKPPSYWASDIWHPNLHGHTLIAEQFTSELMP